MFHNRETLSKLQKLKDEIFLFRFFSHMHPQCSFISLPSSCFLGTLPQCLINSLSFYLHKTADLLVITNKLGISKFNDTRNKLSYQGSIRQHTRKIGVPKTNEMSQPPTLPLLEVPQNTKFHNYNTYSQDLFSSFNFDFMSCSVCLHLCLAENSIYPVTEGIGSCEPLKCL